MNPVITGLLGLALCATLASVAHTALDGNGLPRRQSLRHDLESLSTQNTDLEKHAQALQVQIDALRDYPLAQQWAVRGELGYVLPNELTLELRD